MREEKVKTLQIDDPKKRPPTRANTWRRPYSFQDAINLSAENSSLRATAGMLVSIPARLVLPQ
jgi:hypothetical protein